MKNKKILIIGIVIVVLLIIAGVLTSYIDSERVITNKEPKYCIKTISDDGSKVTYWGLGYKVVRYVGISPNEPYENNIAAKMGNWFMKYELPKVENIEIEYEGQRINITNIKEIGIIENILLNSKYNNETCDGINTHKITLNDGVYYIKESCKELQKGDKQASINDEDLKTINNIIANKISNEQNEEEYYFFGKVIESNEKRIIVEPNENEEIRKSGDKVYIGLEDYNDAIYMVGTNVKITYEGTIMTTYPLQVKATKIDIKSAENFEIVFNAQQPQTNYRVYMILDVSESDKYNYNIYGYGGDVNIIIDNEIFTLREALLQNKITMEEIIAKANQDLEENNITAQIYKDGGSMVYEYDNYSIVKCHTIDGNRNVYIGNKEMKIISDTK